MKKIKISILIIIMLILSMSGCTDIKQKKTDEENDFYQNIIDTEAAWIASIQLSDGAIPDNECIENTQMRVVPYFSLFAVLGLLETDQYYEKVRLFFDWYFENLNREPDINGLCGTIYDFYYTLREDGSYNKAKSIEITGYTAYDSVDSYAALFLYAMRRYVECSGNREYAIEHREDIALIASVIYSKQIWDQGLTCATPDYPEKYIMDNSEVQLGLASAQWLYETVLDDTTQASVYGKLREQNLNAIEERLWSETNGYYCQSEGTQVTDLACFYPDATCQLFTIWTGVIDASGERAAHLYEDFCLSHSDWVLADKDEYPWSLCCLTAATMQDRSRCNEYLLNVKQKYIDTGHQGMWYCAEAGETIMAATLLIE